MTFDNYECDGQLSIFDLVQPDYPDFRTMAEEEIVQYIGNVVGLRFVYNSYLEQWEAKRGKGTFSIHLSHYKGMNNNDLFISCGYHNSTSGWGCPCDSMEEAIKRIRKVMDDGNTKG